MSLKAIKWLLYYYTSLLFIGIIITICALLYDSIVLPINVSFTMVSLLGGIGTALIGSTIFYLRKLYKSCINNEMSNPISDEDKIRELGINAYYYLRPLFAIAFSILIHIALKSSVQIITVKETRLDDGFIYITMFVSFFAGFAAGDLITYIESNGFKWASKPFKD